jgi:hypothetical protein
MRRIAYRFLAAISPDARVGTGALARPSRAHRGPGVAGFWLDGVGSSAAACGWQLSIAPAVHYGGTELRVMLQSAPDALELPANATPADYWDAARTLSLIGDTLVNSMPKTARSPRWPWRGRVTRAPGIGNSRCAAE